jgi:hypothetical protein
VRARISIALAIALVSGTLCTAIMFRTHQGPGDLRSPLRLMERLRTHGDLYDVEQIYPLTAGIITYPLRWLPPEIAAGVFWGISSGLLAFALTRDGYVRLLVFLSCPYWAGLLTVQWSPIIAASAFFPLLLPVTLAKPQIGLPVFLTHPSKKGAIGGIALVVLSIAIRPDWPLLWIRQASVGYAHFLPLFVLPFGPLLLLALARYKNRDAWLLFLMALMPQRWFYDQLILWLIPKSRSEIVWTIFFSWGALYWRLHGVPTIHSVAIVTVLLIYLPMLAVVLRRPRESRQLTEEAGGS